MTAKNRFDIDRLRRLLEAYGADHRRWPEDASAPARALVARSESARALLDEAKALDALLDGATAPEPSPELKAEILAAAGRPAQRPWAIPVWPFGALWKPVSALAAAAMLGIIAGTVLPSPFNGTESALEGEIGQLAMDTMFDQDNGQ